MGAGRRRRPPSTGRLRGPISVDGPLSEPAPPRGTLAGARAFPTPGDPMSKFVIHGGTPLRGEIEASGNKNAILPMIAAALLTDEAVTLENVPAIRDVTAMLEILSGLRSRGLARGRDRHDPGGLALGGRRPSRALRAGPHLVPARGAPARPPRSRQGVRAGRRRDRATPPRRALLRAALPGRDGRRGRAPVHGAAAARGPRHLLRRGERHRDRAHPDGRRARRRADHDPERRLRAARPGPGPPPRAHGGPDRGARHEHDHHRRGREASTARRTASCPTTSRRGATSRSPPRPAASWSSTARSRATTG